MNEYREHPSLAVVWNGERLTPAPEAAAAESTVWFAVPPEPDASQGPQYWEALNASRISDDTLVVRGCPALFGQVAFGDVVRVVASSENVWVVTEIVERGGFESARLWFPGGDSWRAPSEALAAAGCVIDVYSEKLVGIAWPTRDDMRKTLESMEAEGILEYATA